MKKIVAKILCVVALLGFAYIYAHVNIAHEIYNPDVDTDNYLSTGVLINENIEQEFVCKENELDGISIKCATFGERTDVKVKFNLYAADSNKLLDSWEIMGSDIENNKFHLTEIDKIGNCKGRRFLIQMEILGGDKEDGISVYLEKSEPNVNFMRNGNSEEGTLIMRAITHRFDWETFLIVVLFEVYLVAFIGTMYKLFR